MSTPASWVPIAEDSPFGIANLPYGVVRGIAEHPTPVVRIGDSVLPLGGLVDGPFEEPTLNPFLVAGRPVWTLVRRKLIELFSDPAHRTDIEPQLVPVSQVDPVLPFAVADYVDFYASEVHATNLGRIFRPGQAALMPNWKHLPVGYHGRAGTVVVSGTDIVRPCGQRKPAGASQPIFGPSATLDIEAEIGFVVGTPGTRVPAADFAEHVFGVVLVNDWSARDIQSWEYAPLGPFLGKSFATSISPWVVPLDALSGARVPGPRQIPLVLDYLRQGEPRGFDIDLAISWNDQLVSRPQFRHMYWSPAQMLAHLTVNGATVRPGDLFASGTVSGPAPDQRGSFLELCWDGSTPVSFPDGSTRSFLHDHDVVSISATAPAVDGSRIGWGEVSGRILPAHC